MRVHNINGTSQRDCGCGSWLNHWKNFSGQQLSKWCSETNCIHQPEVGAHVQKDSNEDKGWYIVPLCKDHNAKTGDSIEIVSSVRLVSANKKETCEKS